MPFEKWRPTLPPQPRYNITRTICTTVSRTASSQCASSVAFNYADVELQRSRLLHVIMLHSRLYTHGKGIYGWNVITYIYIYIYGKNSDSPSVSICFKYLRKLLCSRLPTFIIYYYIVSLRPSATLSRSPCDVLYALDSIIGIPATHVGVRVSCTSDFFVLLLLFPLARTHACNIAMPRYI